MKYLKILTIVLIVIFSTLNITYSAEVTGGGDNSSSSSNTTDGGGYIETLTTEPTPGYDCVCAIKDPQAPLGYKPAQITEGELCTNDKVYERMFICKKQEGFAGLKDSFRQIIRYIVQISILLGVIALAAFGVAWSVAGDSDPDYKKKLKDWLVGLIIGLAILFFFSQILTGVASWIFTP